MKHTQIPGHGLHGEGKGVVLSGEPCCAHLDKWLMNRGTGGEGHGKCSCGTVSEHLYSGAERKRWYAEHKADAVREREGSA